MYAEKSLAQLQAIVAQALNDDDTSNLTALAALHEVSEGAITLALPDTMVTMADASEAEAILTQLPAWGNVTTIVHSFGSIFEFKNPFPKGKSDYGYYNIMGKEGLHGHLRLDLIKHIAFVSKPFRGMESHYIGFYEEQGHCVFKVYVGRDKKRQLLAHQLEAFALLKSDLTVNFNI